MSTDVHVDVFVHAVTRRLHSPEGHELGGYEPLCGVVISAAVSAESPFTLMEAWHWVRQRHPAVPVAFSALARFDIIVPKLRRELALSADVEVIGSSSDVNAHSAAGTSRLVLLFTDRDLAEQRSKVAQAFVAHFKPS